MSNLKEGDLVMRKGDSALRIGKVLAVSTSGNNVRVLWRNSGRSSAIHAARLVVVPTVTVDMRQKCEMMEESEPCGYPAPYECEQCGAHMCAFDGFTRNGALLCGVCYGLEGYERRTQQ